MPKVKFKRNIHNMLFQKLSEANEYIDLLDLNMPWKLNSTHFICTIVPASHVICLILLRIFVFPKFYTSQYSVIITDYTWFFLFHYLIPTLF